MAITKEVFLLSPRLLCIYFLPLAANIQNGRQISISVRNSTVESVHIINVV